MAKRTFDWEGVEYQSPEYYRRWRLANQEKIRAYHRAYDASRFITHKEAELARRKRWSSNNLLATKAHSKVKVER